MADITPGYKKNDKTNKENYRPINILPPKIFERILYNQINAKMTDCLSPIYVDFVLVTQHILVSYK